jgi:hypothetical protein
MQQCEGGNVGDGGHLENVMIITINILLGEECIYVSVNKLKVFSHLLIHFKNHQVLLLRPVFLTGTLHLLVIHI